MGVKISQLPVGIAEQAAVVPVTNAAANQTRKVQLGDIVALATKQTVGLGNVDNTSDADKPVSTAVQSALDGKAAAVHTHDERYYTESEVDTLLQGKQNSGSYATLDEDGKLSTSQLASGTASVSNFLRGDGTWATVSPAPSVVAQAFSSTLETDASLGDIFDVTITGDVTLANPTNPINGKTLRWRISQDSAGSRIVSLGGKFSIPSSATSPLPWSTGANKMDILAATYHAGRDKWDVVSFVPGY